MSTTLYNSVRKLLNRNSDGAVSPVIGTILMVAVTVILGATVYAAVSVFGSKTANEPVDAVFKVQGSDVDYDNKLDGIKFTYLSGPGELTASEVRLVVKTSSGVTVLDTANDDTSTLVPAYPTEWEIGNSWTYDPAPGMHTVSVYIRGSLLVLDQPVNIVE